ncbi:MAG: hypothetical protein ACRC5M_04475 [Anaeroplasmataceae bacterium]
MSMLINPYAYKTNDNDYVGFESIKKSGIVYKKRKIYLINKINGMKDEYEDSIFNSYRNNLVIMTNTSVSNNEDGEKYYIKSTYTFSYFCSNEDIINGFKSGRLHLKYASTSGYKFRGDESDIIPAEYYTDLGFTFSYGENDDPIEINLNDMDNKESCMTECSLIVPDPRYYTTRQYEIDKGRSCEPIMTKDRTYDGSDLLDESTDIYLIKENENNLVKGTSHSSSGGGMVPVRNSKQIFDVYEKIKEADTIPFDMFLINSQSFFSSYKFIYDSKNGFNIKDITSDSILINMRRRDYVKSIVDKMTKYCEKLTKTYGSIRVHYYSSEILDKVDIIFDDESINKISVTLDKDSTFERMMVFLTDKYETHFIKKYAENYDEYFSYT